MIKLKQLQKLAPVFLIMGCSSSDPALPVLNTQKPLLITEQPAPEIDNESVIGEFLPSGVSDTDGMEVSLDALLPEEVLEESGESSEIQEEGSTEGEAVQQPEPEVPGESAEEPLPVPEVEPETIEGPVLINDIIQPAIIEIEQEVTLSNLEGSYLAVEEWRTPAAGRPQPWVVVEMTITWETNADGVDIIIDGVYETTVTEALYQSDLSVPGELGLTDVEALLPRVEVRAWSGDDEIIEEVVWSAL